jgi:anti-anti-sigma factor
MSPLLQVVAPPTTVVESAPTHLDALSGPELRARLLGAVGPGGHVVVDLAEVVAMDAAGLSAIVAARRALRRRDIALSVRGVRAPAVRRLLADTRYDVLFGVREVQA